MRLKTPALLLAALLAISCAQPGSSPTSPAGAGGALNAGGPTPVLSATMRFGNDSVGSPFPPPSGHDQSGHGRDNLIPRTVVIDKGGTVTFQIQVPVHQVAIYGDGVEAEDIAIGPGTLVNKGAPCPPAPYINDATNRLQIFPAPCEGGSFSPSRTFSTPGKYLVICTLLPHFNVGMYGWIEVRDR